MDDRQIRKIFLDYFEKRGHKIYPSIPLVPPDKSMLFTTAGMVQFKDMFLGNIPPVPAAASIQKCMRTTDIDEVGRTARHLTFFEMLGNFSAGGYFKKEAIDLAWEFLTEVLCLDKERLYATVYKEDSEARVFWKKYLPNEKIVSLGEEDNFWKMGETGPCGPCSEIVWDMGEDVGCLKKDCFIGCPCDRWLEVWNLVFTEFDRQPSGLKPLKQKNIDTGMGLERLVTITEGKKDVFECSTLKPIVKTIEEASSEKNSYHIKRIADHIRAAIFLLSDSVFPSNVGRGYVLRRLIRRAATSANRISIQKPLWQISNAVFEIFAPIYPEIEKNASRSTLILKKEVEKFEENLSSGMEILKKVFHQVKIGSKVSAEIAFDLYSTYGIPIEVTEEIADSYGFGIDKTGFEKLLEKEKKISRISWEGEKGEELSKFASKYPPTEFIGWDNFECEEKVLNIVDRDLLTEGDEGLVVFPKTVFYPEKGGEVADTGVITGEGFSAEVEDVFLSDGVIFHKVKVLSGEISKGSSACLSVDKARRLAISRNHTATHILQAVLRKVIGDEVTQAGSYVSSDGFRFDFTVSRKIEEDEMDKIEHLANEIVFEALPVFKKEYPIEEARKFPALQFFDEKYGEIVRVVTIGSDDPFKAVSCEFCGGCHVSNTGEIGIIKIISQKAVAQGIRRINAVTGFSVLKYIREKEDLLFSLARILKTSVESLPNRVSKILEESKKKSSSALADVDAKKVNFQGVEIFVAEAPSDNTVSNVADNLREKTKGVVFVYAIRDGKISYVFEVHPSLVEKGISAKKLLSAFAAKTSTSGGGNEKFARGGGKWSQNFKIEEIIK